MQSFGYDDDEIELIFSDEPGHVYSIPVIFYTTDSLNLTSFISLLSFFIFSVLPHLQFHGSKAKRFVF